tara:strand:- start:129 stop:464 length:336 start_codon:yes stop_codon:yes gene_type:complete
MKTYTNKEGVEIHLKDMSTNQLKKLIEAYSKNNNPIYLKYVESFQNELDSRLILKLILVKTDEKTGQRLRLDQQEINIQNQNQDSLYRLEERIASYKKLNKKKFNYLIKIK